MGHAEDLDTNLRIRKSYHLTVDSLGSTVTVTGWELMREGIPVRLETLGSSELLLFLAAPERSYLNGTIIPVDGD